jgi:hypothetical protein
MKESTNMNNNLESKIKELNNYIEAFQKNHAIEAPSNLEELKENFKKLFDGSLLNEIPNLSITEFFRNKLIQPNSDPKQFEYIIAHLFYGQVSDLLRKKMDAKTLVDKNILKKGDVLFDTNYEISIKTLFEQTKELNLGAFSVEVLLKGFLDVGPEMKQLGSKARMLLMFKQIQQKGLWNEFVNHLEFNMVRKIYTKDMVLIIKKVNGLDIYFVPAKNLCDVLINAAKKGPEELVKVINRFNNSAMRINRQVLMDKEVSTMISIDFTETNGKTISDYKANFEDYFSKVLLGTITYEELMEIHKNTPKFI